MTQNNNSTQQYFTPAALGKRMLIGAAIGLIVISAFIFGAGEPNPAWPKFWIIRPLIIVPFAGAAGGVFSFLMDPIRYQGGWKKVLAIILTVIVFIIGLWLGVVLGLAGTMWH